MTLNNYFLLFLLGQFCFENRTALGHDTLWVIVERDNGYSLPGLISEKTKINSFSKMIEALSRKLIGGYCWENLAL